VSLLDRFPETSLSVDENAPFPEPPPPDYANSIPFPPAPPSGIPNPAPCPACGLGLYWLDAYDGLHCYDCTPPPVEALAVQWLFVMVVNPPGEGSTPCYEWLDFDWMREYPPTYWSRIA
jgi:hypothetical protein